MTSANKSLEKKNFPSGWKCYKTIGSYVSCAFIEIWSTWEVWRALKKLELLSATPRATLTHLSCSPNFPRASYLDERTLSYEPIVDESGTYRRLKTSLNTDCLSVKLCLFPIISFHLVRTYAIMRILMGVILGLKRSQWAKRLYLLQLKDYHFHNNYKGRKVVSHIYVRTPLQVGFDGDFVTYHAGYLQT